jgi:hypothetical protein
MLLGIVVLLLVATIAYFHYVQGLFSATISAICAIFAAVISLSYTENIIAALLKGAAANYAQSMVLVGLFAITYVILRQIFDRTIPGNVTFPLYVDRVGGAVMGVIAGLFAMGVLVMAAGSMPFGASVGGYARYQLGDRNGLTIPGKSTQIDTAVENEIKDNQLDEGKYALDPKKRTGLLLPVDDLVVGTVNTLSNGALGNDHPLAAVHPDWPTELFGQRAGVQVGTKHVLLNLPGLEMVNLKDVFKLDSVTQLDGELKEVRETPLVPEKGETLKPTGDEILLVTRIQFTDTATDEDTKVRVSPASVRLVGYETKGGSSVYQNFHPIGTLEGTNVLLRNKPDDFLVINGGKAVDFVFKLPKAFIFDIDSPKAKDLEIKSGVFVEVKRMAQMDLGGKTIKPAVTPDKDVEVNRKPLPQLKNVNVIRASAGGGGAAAGKEQSAAAEGALSPIDGINVAPSSKLLRKLSVGPFQGDPANTTIGSGNATITKQKFVQKLTLNAQENLSDLQKNEFPIEDFFVPQGKGMVHVTGKAGKAVGNDRWAWASSLGSFELVDATGNHFKPNGAMALVKVEGSDRLVANYDAENPVAQVDKGDGTPFDVMILFNVPSGTQVTQVLYDGKVISTKGAKVP